jgi:pyruvate formate lyase activating enzyme
MIEGTIFSIEEFALNDGPGIRTTVFLKGCPLRCVWCHNPEGIPFAPQMLSTQQGERLCGERYTASRLAGVLLRGSEFFRATGGGVTFTGGEPLAQPDFLAAVLGMLPGVHTAIETSGFSSGAVFRRIISLTDLVLLDIKSMDRAMHERYTGVNNTQILRNLDCLCMGDKPFIIRLPLIPGINDSREQMTMVLERIKGAPALQRVEMLRYHLSAGAKYAMTGQSYAPPFDPSREVAIHNVFEENNIKTIIL